MLLFGLHETSFFNLLERCCVSVADNTVSLVGAMMNTDGIARLNFVIAMVR